LALAGLFDWIIVLCITQSRYGFVLSKRALKVFLLQAPFIAAALVVTFRMEGWWYWIAGCLVVISSSAISFHYLRKNTTLIDRLRDKIKRRFKL
jgi:hypothetical protein